MSIIVNGAERELPAVATVAALVGELRGGEADTRGVAVAVEGEVVPRGQWDSATLKDGDRVEVLMAVQGG